MMLGRRELIKGLGAAATQYLVGCAASRSPGGSTDAPPLSDEDLLAIHLDAMAFEEGAGGGFVQKTFEDIVPDRNLRNEIRSTRILPALKAGELQRAAIADGDSPDVRHLAVAADVDQTFRLNHDVLASMVSANHFDTTLSMRLGRGRRPVADKILFGLRGCVLVDPKSAARGASDVEVREAQVDHRNLRCTMGVWDRTARTVSAFEASTVPHLVYMQVYRIYQHFVDDSFSLNDSTMSADDVISNRYKKNRFSAWKANQLAQGLHVMAVGKHLNRFEGLLTQDRYWFGPVLRARDVLGYRYYDWDKKVRRVGDNIHPTWALGAVGFASAGCNVVKGSGGRPPYRGSIRRLLEALDGRAGDRFYYTLFSGREARLHALRAGGDLRRWRFGASGPSVRTLQQDVLGQSGSAVDGVFGAGVHQALLAWQRQQGLAFDGVVTPSMVGDGA